MKFCRKCETSKPLTEFYKNRSAHDGLQSHCKVCQSTRHHHWTDEQRVAHYERTSDWKRRNPEKAAAIQRRASLKRLYGIAPEEYDILLEEQGGACAVCGISAEDKPRPLAVDHDHETGEIRGLLCDACNLGIGCLQDSPALLESALTYLQKRVAA